MWLINATLGHSLSYTMYLKLVVLWNYRSLLRPLDTPSNLITRSANDRKVFDWPRNVL